MFEFTCPDCEKGGKRWATAKELGVHLCREHPEWSLAEIERELAEQDAMRVEVVR